MKRHAGVRRGKARERVVRRGGAGGRVRDRADVDARRYPGADDDEEEGFPPPRRRPPSDSGARPAGREDRGQVALGGRLGRGPIGSRQEGRGRAGGKAESSANEEASAMSLARSSAFVLTLLLPASASAGQGGYFIVPPLDQYPTATES